MKRRGKGVMVGTVIQGGPTHKRIYTRELRENFSAFSVKIIDFLPISDPMSQNSTKNGEKPQKMGSYKRKFSYTRHTYSLICRTSL